MDKNIIIDGVNVAGCDFYQIEANELYPKAQYCGSMRNTFCENESNCYYKQLKRLEQENKELKKDVQLFKCLDTFGESECHCACRCLGNEFCEDADKKINSYRSALEEISSLIDKIHYRPVAKMKEIQELIKKVLNP